MDRPEAERVAIYRQVAPLANWATSPPFSEMEKLSRMEMILDTGFELKSIVDEVPDMNVITVKYCELVNRFSSWLPTQWKAAIKNTIGWDLNRADPRVLRAIYVDQRLLAAMLELDPELAADDLPEAGPSNRIFLIKRASMKRSTNC